MQHFAATISATAQPLKNPSPKPIVAIETANLGQRSLHLPRRQCHQTSLRTPFRKLRGPLQALTVARRTQHTVANNAQTRLTHQPTKQRIASEFPRQSHSQFTSVSVISAVWDRVGFRPSTPTARAGDGTPNGYHQICASLTEIVCPRKPRAIRSHHVQVLACGGCRENMVWGGATSGHLMRLGKQDHLPPRHDTGRHELLSTTGKGLSAHRLQGKAEDVPKHSGTRVVEGTQAGKRCERPPGDSTMFEEGRQGVLPKDKPGKHSIARFKV